MPTPLSAGEKPKVTDRPSDRDPELPGWLAIAHSGGGGAAEQIGELRSTPAGIF